MNPLLSKLVYLNFVEGMREFSRWQQSSQLVEQDGLLFVAGSTPFPLLLNYVLRLDAAIAAPELLDKATAFFQARGRGFTLLSYGEQDKDLEAAAQAAGMQQLVDAPEMVLDTPVDPPEIPRSVEIRRASVESEILDVRHISSEAYESIDIPKEHTQAVFGVPRRLLSPQLIIYIAYFDGQPVSTAITLMTEQVAGIYWVGTIPAARGQGLAEACTRLATNAGLARGAQVAALQASPMGKAIYERIGYRTFEQVKFYLASLNSSTS